MMWWLLNLGFRIINPVFWIQNEPTCWRYDHHLRQALNDPDCNIEIIDSYTAKINGVQVWINNYPYAFGNLWPSNYKEVLPSPLTRLKLKRILDKKRSSL
jgi:hypothetical protein